MMLMSLAISSLADSRIAMLIRDIIAFSAQAD